MIAGQSGGELLAGQNTGEQSNACPRVSDIESRIRSPETEQANAMNLRRSLAIDYLHTQRAHARGRTADIRTHAQILDNGRSTRDGPEHQRPVRNRFITWDGDLTGDSYGGLNSFLHRSFW
jgi:hypothetical protein